MLYQAQMRNFIRLVLIALLGSSLASCSTWVSDDFAARHQCDFWATTPFGPLAPANP